MHVCFMQLRPVKTKLMTLRQSLHEIHGHINHVALITKQPHKEVGLSLAATHFWKPSPCEWVVLTPSMVLAWMGTGCDDRAGQWIQCQCPVESWKMHQTTQQWLLAQKKLPWILDPTIAEQMKVPPFLSSAITYRIFYPLPAGNLSSSTLISPLVSPFSPLQSSFLNYSFHPEVQMSYRHLHLPKQQRRNNNSNLASIQGIETLKRARIHAKSIQESQCSPSVDQGFQLVFNKGFYELQRALHARMSLQHQKLVKCWEEKKNHHPDRAFYNSVLTLCL